jgi:hypothetical protein
MVAWLIDGEKTQTLGPSRAVVAPGHIDEAGADDGRAAEALAAADGIISPAAIRAAARTDNDG